MDYFVAFPKIPRLRRGIVISEKIDGTNAAVIISAPGTDPNDIGECAVTLEDGTIVRAASRTRIITPVNDNYGFARFVFENAKTLAADLGVGYHYGEWWGAGIQRRYGLAGNDKRFSLFQATRWKDATFTTPGVGVVPILYQGPMADDAIDSCLQSLRDNGSVAAPRYMFPEGIVVFHTASREMFKVTCEKDEESKGEAARRAA